MDYGYGWCKGIKKLRMDCPTRIWEQLDSDAPFESLPVGGGRWGEEGGWLRRVGIPWLNGQLHSATWPFEYNMREPRLTLRATRDKKTMSLCESSDRTLQPDPYSTSVQYVITQPRPQDGFGYSSQLDNNYIVQEGDNIYCYAPVKLCLPGQVWTSQVFTGRGLNNQSLKLLWKR